MSANLEEEQIVIGRDSIRHWLSMWLPGIPQLKKSLSIRRDVVTQ